MKKHPKKKQAIASRYIKIDGIRKRIPKIVYGQHPDIINMYFRVPEVVRKNWRQLILKANDKLTFGPLKGKVFQSLLKNTDESIKLYYRDKFLLASKNERFVQKIANYFNPFNSLPEELEIRIVDIEQ